VGNDPVNNVDLWGLWGSDVHFDDTLKWANEIFNDENKAQIIAKADNDVDSGFTNPVFGDQSWHFNTNNFSFTYYLFNESSSGTSEDSRVEHSNKQMEIAALLYNIGLEDESFRELGKGLHALQDLYAHDDKYVGYMFIVERWAHLGGDADNKKINSTGYDKTILATNNYLEQYQTRIENKNK